MQKSKLVTITGPSGSGKSTLEAMLVETGEFTKAVSHTTRPMREGEIHGKDYYFISPVEFHDMLTHKQFVESIHLGGNSYGVSVDELKRNADTGKITVLVCEPQGARQIRAHAKLNETIDPLHVYISGEPVELIRRFLEREPVTEKNAKAVALRIHNLIKHELKWSSDMSWDRVFSRFDSENQDLVIRAIRTAFSFK